VRLYFPPSFPPTLPSTSARDGTRRQRGRSGIATRAGFTLVELMVALALAAVISIAIMVISSQAQQTYNTMVRKVDVYNKFRYAILSIERDFQSWISTSNLEFFMDGRGAGSRRNENWDPGEEVPDPPGKYMVVDGGQKGYEEFAYILERHYVGYEDKMNTERKIHDAYQAYFRTRTFIDGRVREANVEYMLVDPTTVEGQGAEDRQKVPLPPTEVKFDDMQGLSLYKIIRYHDFQYSELAKQSLNFPIVKKVVEVCTNITDFRIEYTADNRYDPKVTSGFKTPKEDFDAPVEKAVRPQPVTEAMVAGIPGYRKTFGYGTFRIPNNFPRASAFRAVFGDRLPRADHRPVQFGWERNPDICFAELTPGDKIFIFTEASRGGGMGTGGVAGISSYLIQFPVGNYTVKTNVAGKLQFIEDIDSTTWQREMIPGIYYKAPFIPQAIRITMRVIDETDSADRQAKTLQRVVWIRGKAR
jgi:prepilin-type N-terminal cleavage/methylation domain-containing protein